MPASTTPLRLALAGWALAVASCTVSIEPIVPASAAVFDPLLLGTWDEVGGSDRVVVTLAPDSAYAIEYTSDGTTARLVGRLGPIGGVRVLDVSPAADDGPGPTPSSLMIPVHMSLVLEATGDEIRTRGIDRDALRKSLDLGGSSLPYGHAGDRLVLHGSTEALRTALEPHLADSDVLTEPTIWRRGRNESRPDRVSVPCFESSAWREADRLFRADPRWAGGDAASSVDLGGGRILWLFGDSWIDPSARAERRGAHMVSNTVAIQTGPNPAEATMRFYWGRAADGGPSAFIPDAGEERLWFGNGVLVGDRLVLFLNRLRSATAGLGFESVGWAAWMVDNPGDEPSSWRLHRIETPANPLGVLLGFGAVLRKDEYVYALGSQDPVKSHPVYAARWPAEHVRQGNLLQPEWYAGERTGWVPDSSSAARRPLFENGQSEFSMHRDAATGTFLVVQTQGFGPSDVTIRVAPELTGPWTLPRIVYRPPEYYRPNVMIYSAKAHPELRGAELVLTYATNSFSAADHLADGRIYYPRFVRMERCD